MEAQVADIPTGNLGEQAEPKCWETRLEAESPKAFKAFCMFRNMGYKRSIKACLELHEIDPKSMARGHVMQDCSTGMKELPYTMSMWQRKQDVN